MTLEVGLNHYREGDGKVIRVRMSVLYREEQDHSPEDRKKDACTEYTIVSLEQYLTPVNKINATKHENVIKAT